MKKIKALLKSMGAYRRAFEERVASAGEPLSSLDSGPGVASDEQTYSIAAVSNDTSYIGGQLWGMYGDTTTSKNAFGSQAGEAWAAGHVGSMKVAVGVIDSGLDYTHADLFRNVWLNQGEIPTTLRPLLLDTDGDGLFTFRDLNDSRNASFVGDYNSNGRIDGGDLLRDRRWANGVDEAGNGYLDDLIGWDFVNNDNDPFDDNGHGTHVSGTIAAQGGNGIGVVGVAWSAQLVTLKFLDAAGSGSSTNAVKAIDYFTNARTSNPGLDFVATNNSWGGGGYSQSVADAVGRGAKADILFVAAAGNGGADGIGDNNDGGYYPSGYNTGTVAGYDAVVSVAALTSTGQLAGFSNYGATSVDLAAPGASILSTTRGGGYGSMSGTSMATPHVAGAVAAFAAAHPTFTAAQIRSEMMGSTTPTASVSGKVSTGGRLDVAEFLALPKIFGTTGSDTVRGTAANEIISGVPATGINPGRASVDTLWGGGGNDLFVLGDARGKFYVDAYSGSGRGDYAQIRDWAAGDRIQLSGSASQYHFRAGSQNGLSGLSIFVDSNNNRAYDTSDEFIGHVVGMSAFRPEAFTYA